MYERLKQGQKVNYKYGDVEGTGKVVGLSSQEVMFFGATYIIEPDVPIENYEYSHFILCECYLKKIE